MTISSSEILEPFCCSYLKFEFFTKNHLFIILNILIFLIFSYFFYYKKLNIKKKSLYLKYVNLFVLKENLIKLNILLKNIFLFFRYRFFFFFKFANKILKNVFFYNKIRMFNEKIYVFILKKIKK